MQTDQHQGVAQGLATVGLLFYYCLVVDLVPRLRDSRLELLVATLLLRVSLVLVLPTVHPTACSLLKHNAKVWSANIYKYYVHSVKKQVQLHFSCTAVSSEDSSATDLLMLQIQYKIVHVCTGTYMHTVCAMGVWFAI